MNSENLNWYGLRISVLWVLATVAFFAYARFAAGETPEDFNNLSLVSDGELARVTLVMMLLALLSLVLKGSMNRLVNYVGGVVLAIATIIVLIDGLAVHAGGTYNLMMGATVLILLSVVWFARKMPKTGKAA